MIVGVDHIQIAMPVGGESAAIAFYSELLGLEQVPKPPELAVRGGCWFATPTLQIHLGADPNVRPDEKGHPAFLVDDRAALAERLVAAGVATRDGTTVAGVTQLFCDDPFGNRIEFVSAPTSSA
ncbi:MAG: VOC family protein [Acidimicrobiales bacterium]